MVQRLLPHPVAREHEALGTRIPQRQPEHAVELIHEVQPQLLVEMGDHLGIAPGPEAMPARSSRSRSAPVIVDLAVADHADRAVLVRERLPTVRDVDDRQPPAAESGAALDRHPVAVGPAVDQRLTHALEQGRIRLPARTHHDTVDPAHQPVPAWCRGVMPTCTWSLLDPREYRLAAYLRCDTAANHKAVSIDISPALRVGSPCHRQGEDLPNGYALSLSRRAVAALRRPRRRLGVHGSRRPRHRPLAAGVLRSAGTRAVHAALPERLLHRGRQHVRHAPAHPFHPRRPPEEPRRHPARVRRAEPIRRLQPRRRADLLDAGRRPGALERSRHQRHRALPRARFSHRHHRRAQRQARAVVGRTRPAVGSGQPVAHRASGDRLHRRPPLHRRRAPPHRLRRDRPAAVARLRSIPRRHVHHGRDVRVTPSGDGEDLPDAPLCRDRSRRPPAGVGLHGRQHQEHHRTHAAHP